MGTSNQRLLITISSNKLREQLDEISGCFSIPKSKIIVSVLNDYLDEWVHKKMANDESSGAGRKTNVGSIQNELHSEDINVLIDYLKKLGVELEVVKQMTSSTYQHLICGLGLSAKLGLPEIGPELKNVFDTSIPPNFQQLENDLLTQPENNPNEDIDEVIIDE